MVYNCYLSDLENIWVGLFLSIFTPYSDILSEQIMDSKVSREYGKYYIFLNFSPSEVTRKLPRFRDRVPIEILVQHITDEGQQMGTVYYSHGLSDQCIEGVKSENGTEPTSFLMHIIDGSIRQIEIYNLDSSEIDVNKICIGRIDYRISSDFMNSV